MNEEAMSGEHPSPPGHRHPAVRVTAIVVFVAFGALAVWVVGSANRQTERQDAFDPFYRPPPVPAGARPGELIRSEPMSLGLTNGDAHRILYWSQTEDGTLRASSGMLLVPHMAAPAGGRDVLAWAHPTVGLGVQCAPSRTEDPLADMTWADQALANGWVIAATDYAGLGTPGTEPYLIGRDEARDVLNSVRAAQAFPGADAGGRFALFGHSQGGHSVLFTVQETPSYAPELELVAAAAAAPAAELVPLFSQQHTSPLAWVLASPVVLAWPQVYPDLPTGGLLTDAAMQNYERLARECIEAAGIEGFLRTDVLREAFFTTDPMTDPTWLAAAQRETPAPVGAGVPLFIAQSTADQVVLPNTTSLFVERSCDAGGSVRTDWVDYTDELGHGGMAILVGPDVVIWLAQMFDGVANQSSCGVTPPVAPADPVPTKPTS